MPRPPEYENLIRTRALEEVQQTPGAIEGFLKDAAESLEVARTVDVRRPKQRFILAYEGFYSLVQAVLEFYSVRTKESGRNLAILRAAADLNLDADEIRLVSAAHGRRNDTTYRSPFPPISRAEAQAMIDVLGKTLPVTHMLTGVPAPAAGQA